MRTLWIAVVAGVLAIGASTARGAWNPADTVHVAVPADSASADDDVDSVVTYQANDTILYRVNARTMRLTGKSEARYQGQKLNADVMDIDFTTSTLTAKGRSDSSGRSTLGTPVFDDRGELYKGNTLIYNFKTKRGNILLSSTKLDNGYYYADKVFRETDKVYFIKNGRYTTCDCPDPHFYFASPKMKVMLQEQVLAAPVYLFIADVPLFAVPFGLFPNHGGRSSGLIAPAYGQVSSRGFFLQHLGYYWATNDYMDVAATTDLYTKGSTVYNGLLNYALRYNFAGSLAASFARTRMTPDEPISSQWSLTWHHNQTFDPRTTLSANLRFMSQSFLQSTSTSLPDLLSRSILSDASFSTGWDNSSLSVQYSRSQDLLTNHIFESPTLNFTLQQFYPFRSAKTSQGSEAWYELLGLAYSGTVRVNHDVRNDTVKSDDLKGEVVHTPTISFTPKLGQFSVSPFFHYNEVWYAERVEQSMNPADSTIIDHKIAGFNRVGWYDMGVSVSTRLYGIVEPRLFGITAIRHTLSPSFTYTYHPDFADAKYGYTGTYFDYRNQRQVQYSYFARELSGGAPAGKQQNLGLSLNNTFEMKIAHSDTVEERVQLLNATVSANYNLAADSFKLSDVQLSARTNILGAIDIAGGATLSPYFYNADSGRRMDRYKWQAGNGFFDVTSVNFSASTNFTLMQGAGHDSSHACGRDSEESDELAWERYLGQDGGGHSTFHAPLSVSLAYTFSQSQPTPNVISSRSSSMSAGMRLQLTPTINISANGYYDFVSHTLSAPSINVTKDLHCWEMNFIWYPTDQYLQGFSLEIRVKAPQLHDIKVTKRDNVHGLF